MTVLCDDDSTISLSAWEDSQLKNVKENILNIYHNSHVTCTVIMEYSRKTCTRDVTRGRIQSSSIFVELTHAALRISELSLIHPGTYCTLMPIRFLYRVLKHHM